MWVLRDFSLRVSALLEFFSCFDVASSWINNQGIGSATVDPLCNKSGVYSAVLQ